MQNFDQKNAIQEHSKKRVKHFINCKQRFGSGLKTVSHLFPA